MRGLTFRSKLVLSHAAVVVATVLLLGFTLERSLRTDLETQRQEQLTEQARGALGWVGSGRHPERVAERIAAIVQADVTIFDARGCVIGSSRGPAPRVIQCAPPPEVVHAMAGEVGVATRNEAEHDYNFVALQSSDGNVLRLGAELSEIDAPVAAMQNRLLVASGVGVALSVLLAFLAARLAARPLGTMAREASRIARGDYAVRFPPLPSDEFGHLAVTLEALANQLAIDMNRIAKLESTRRDLVANVTHELRTPVAAIMACAETLQGDLDDAARSRFLDQMQKHAERLSGLVDSLLTLAQLEQQQDQASPKQAVDLAHVSREVAQTMTQRAAERGVSLHVDVPSNARVSGHASQLEQVAENLVDNALKYASSGKSIEIRAERDEQGWLWCISDRGSGIAEEHRERIFERFYRVDAGRSRDRGGAGLGLAIVRHLVELSGGTIEQRPREGGGSTFAIQLSDWPESS